MREVVQGFQSPPYWMAYFGPAGMPPAVVKRLHGEIGKSLEPQDVRTKFDAMGFTVRTGTPEELAAKVKSDMSLAERIVKSAKIQPE
jgi:tripartite-type tricarboxylate transporter receptor subunit TctC